MTTFKGGLGALKTAQIEATAATEAQTVAQAELDVAMVASPLGITVVAVAALAAGLAFLYFKSENSRASVNALGATLKDTLLPVMQTSLEILNDIIDGFSKADKALNGGLAQSLVALIPGGAAFNVAGAIAVNNQSGKQLQAGSASGGASTINNVTVQATPGTDKAGLGKEISDLLDSFNRQNG